MIGSNPTIEKLSAEVGKKTRQIDMLESSINRLTSELEVSKKTIQEIKKENTLKASSLAKLEETNGKLAKEVKQREHAMVSLQSQVEGLKAKSSPRGAGRSPRMVSPVLGARVSSDRSSDRPSCGSGAEEQQADLSVRASSLQQEVKSLQKEVDMLRAAAKSSSSNRSFLGSSDVNSSVDMKRIRGLKDEVETWKTRAENLMSELKVTQRKQAAAEAEAERTRNLAAQAQDGKMKAEIQLKSAQQELSQLREHVVEDYNTLKSELKRSEGVAARHASDADTVASHAQSLQRKIEALRDENTSLDASAKDAVTRMEEAKSAVKSLESEKVTLSQMLDEKTIALSALHAQIESLEASKRTSEDQYESLCAKLGAAHSAAVLNESNTAILAGKMNQAVETENELASRLRATQERCDAAELAMEALKSQVEASREELLTKSTEHKQVVEALEESRMKLAAATLGETETSAEKNAAVTSSEILKKKVETLEETVSTKEETIDELLKKVEVLESDLKESGKQKAEMELLLGNAEGALGTVKTRSAEETLLKESETERLVQELEIANARAEAAEKFAKEAEHLHKNAVDALGKVEAELQEVKSELAESELLIKSESERVQVHSQLLDDKEDDASRLQAEVAKLKSQIADMEEHVREAVDKEVELKKLHESLLSGNEELSMLQDQLQESQKKYEHALSIQREKENDVYNFESRNREMELQMENMRHEVDASQEKLQEFERKIVETDVKMSDLRSQAREYELEAKEAKHDAEEARKESDQLKEELRELQKQLSSGMMATGAGEAKPAVSADAEQALLQKISHLESEVSKKDEELVAAKDEVKVERRRASAAAMKAAGIDDISHTGEEKLVIDSEESTDSVVNSLVTSIFAKFN
eukprot:jgi/Picsp_1/3885/NSC_01397-R1_hypothetical protein CHLNCDRAFT_58975 [Chlorella variabilis]